MSKGPSDPVLLCCNEMRNQHLSSIFSREEGSLGNYYDPNLLAGAIKDVAWSYENEIRIRCDVMGEFVPESVFIDIPDFILQSMTVTAGPMFYGNLEYRLGSLACEVACLNYSVFRHQLQNMPCSEYLYSSGQCNTCCAEKLALEAARSDIPVADQIVLEHPTGKGVFHFPEKGLFTIGSGEYLFQIHWFHDGKNIHLNIPVGKNSFFSSFPSPGMLCYYQLSSSENSEITNGEPVIIANPMGRVAAISFQPDGSNMITRNYEMEYQIFMQTKIVILNAEVYGKQQREFQSLIFQDPQDPLCGTWWDINSKRCHMSIGKKDDRYCVTIDWASSASINSEWFMSGTWDTEWNGMLCSDEQRVATSYYENGTVQVITEYVGGSSKLLMINGEIYWEDAKKETGGRCRFVKDPA